MKENQVPQLVVVIALDCVFTHQFVEQLADGPADRKRNPHEQGHDRAEENSDFYL